MAVNALVLSELDVGDVAVACAAERVGDLALLPGGEEDIACDAEDEGGSGGEWGEAGC